MKMKKFDMDKELELLESNFMKTLTEIEKAQGAHCAEVFRISFSVEMLAQTLKGVRRFYTTLRRTDQEKERFKMILSGLETSVSAASEVIYLWTAAKEEAIKLIKEFSNGKKRVTFK